VKKRWSLSLMLIILTWSVLALSTACASSDSATANTNDLGTPAIGTSAITRQADTIAPVQTTADSSASSSSESTVSVDRYSCPADYVTQTQVMTSHGGAAICRLPGGIVAQYVLIAVSDTYDNGQPQVVKVIQALDIVGDALSGSEYPDTGHRIYISKVNAGLMVEGRQAFQDPVTEILEDNDNYQRLPDSSTAPTAKTHWAMTNPASTSKPGRTARHGYLSGWGSPRPSGKTRNLYTGLDRRC